MERYLSILEVSHASLNLGPVPPNFGVPIRRLAFNRDGDCTFGEAFTLALALILRSSLSNLDFLPGLKGIGGFTGSGSLVYSAGTV